MRKFWLGLLATLALGLASPAVAADVTIGWQCASTSVSGVTTYGQCPASLSNPVPVAQTQLVYTPAPNNTSTAQLAASATFNGTIDQIINEQVISINMTSDQPVTLTIHQYIDAAGTYELPQITTSVLANAGINQSWLINGNYVKVSVQNTGASTTTTFNLNTYYGPSQIPASSGGLANVTVANASSITIGSVYLLDSGGTNKASINASGQLATVLPTTDPCETSGVAKSSAVINLNTAGTTQLVAVSGTKATYVCGFALTIAPSAILADTALFEYGTSTTCVGTTALTGTFGAGDLTTATGPTVVSYGGGQTVFGAPASNGVCVVAAGTTVNIQGVMSYVQQ